jgi:Ankyrin repeats (3 copies)/SAM domain (Sterile alpha motif)/Ankyrin repeats (many copies)
MSHFKSFSSEEIGHTNMIDLQTACRMGDLSAIKNAYNKNKKNLNQKDEIFGWTPLYRTVICGNINACQFLLSSGADPNIPNNLGESPLHQASDNSQYQIAELLLKHHADPNLQQNEGDTPLHHAAFRGDLKIIQLLLNYQADPNLPNFMFGRTPLHTAAESPHEAAMKLLIDYNADPYLQDRQGKTTIDLIPSQSSKNLIEKYHMKSSKDITGKSKLESFTKYSSYKYFDSSSIPQNQTTYEPDAEVSVVPKKNQLKPLYNWLEKINLQEVYEILCEGGYDDIESLIDQMKSPLPITLDELMSTGIKKPGHRYRLLFMLEDEAGVPIKKIMKKSNENSKNFWKCCDAPSNTTYAAVGSITLREWLRTLKLEELTDMFVDAGFDQYDMILAQMISRYPITDEILMNDIGILKPGHRNRILGKLKEEAKSLLDKSENYLQIENLSKQTSCDACLIS